MENSKAAAEADMTTKTETSITSAQQRQYRAEKFILSNLDSGLSKHVQNMNRRQLTLSRKRSL
ncbi:hypothetical protein [Escherichia coli ISC7]|uniref:Uncharacterized protein n=1 Tax=Escherichia coli ISC7 TaxID=1432555 RepID=W1F1E0_ECOLX|nr:hypothetical protein [Escherichia coli ISC7]